ncbi:hypothetical protein KUTeg_008749 [Tegillarca granosa]|uniref:Sulfatase N-terminal domain-containing protein n=1 Tax=Tegillarca granosa TaxID=220873 RepID=A0ABQ9FEU6_TEGGR|nr:hypothetical protein KUTeg_008749 [Tegillarca granosa]
MQKGDYLYTLRANQVITQHDQTKPLFLYLPFQSVHQPIQVPKVYEDMYKNIENKGRRQFSGMVTAMDDAIGNVINTLKKTGMYNETLIIFTSDNGGWPKYFGNNYPLRGSKTTIYEGGTRAATFIHGTMLKKTGYTYSGMMHAVDWMPTIVSAAGGTPVPGIDGLNQWPSLLNGSESKRSEFIYNLDDLPPPFCVGHAAIRSGDYKLIQGFPGPYPGWYKPPQYDGEDVVEDKRFNRTYGDYQLFNLKDDPNEHEDLSLKKGEILKQLLAKMNKYREDMVAANFPNLDPKSSPTNYNGFWSPGWCVQGKPPHILFIVADDLGWNDVGFRNPDIKSPNIDKLAKEGVKKCVYVWNHGAIFPEQATCAPLNFTYLPQQLKQLGYATHMIGNFFLPFKFNRNLQIIIKYSMVTAMDDAIGNIINTLKKTGMYNETLIIFTADNGGWPQFFGNNYPLRGSKVTVYEGGTRASAFIHGTMLKKTGYTYNGMLHAVDWMPTIVSAAGGTPASGIDGLNQWPSLLDGSESKRTEFIYNLDDKLPAITGHAAIRSGDYKLIQGYPGPYPGWYKPPQYVGEDIVEDKTLNMIQMNMKICH